MSGNCSLSQARITIILMNEKRKSESELIPRRLSGKVTNSVTLLFTNFKKKKKLKAGRSL